MKKEIEEAVRASRIIAIIRNFSTEACLKLAEAYEAGGIRLVEVAFNPKCSETWNETAQSIRAIRDRFAGTLHVGAGTVLTMEQLLILMSLLQIVITVHQTRSITLENHTMGVGLRKCIQELPFIHKGLP